MKTMKYAAHKKSMGWWHYRGHDITHDAYGWRVLNSEDYWIGDWHETLRAAKTWIDTRIERAK